MGRGAASAAASEMISSGPSPAERPSSVAGSRRLRSLNSHRTGRTRALTPNCVSRCLVMLVYVCRVPKRQSVRIVVIECATAASHSLSIVARQRARRRARGRGRRRLPGQERDGRERPAPGSP